MEKYMFWKMCIYNVDIYPSWLGKVLFFPREDPAFIASSNCEAREEWFLFMCDFKLNKLLVWPFTLTFRGLHKTHSKFRIFSLFLSLDVKAKYSLKCGHGCKHTCWFSWLKEFDFFASFSILLTLSMIWLYKSITVYKICMHIFKISYPINNNKKISSSGIA